MPPEPLILFTDRDLGTRFPALLRDAGLDVRVHRDLFAPDCADEIWLEHIGKANWIAISHDSRIRYKPNELAAVQRHNVRLLIVVGKAPYPELARNFSSNHPGNPKVYPTTPGAMDCKAVSSITGRYPAKPARAWQYYLVVPDMTGSRPGMGMLNMPDFVPNSSIFKDLLSTIAYNLFVFNQLLLSGPEFYCKPSSRFYRGLNPARPT